MSEKVETVTTEKVQETKQEQAEPKKVEAKPVKGFTQEEVNKIVADRLERERSALAKALGAEQFDKEQIATAFKTAQEQLEAEKKAREKVEQDLTQKQHEALAYRYGIKPEKVDEALTLANLKAKKESVDVSEALQSVAKEYTNLTSVKVKGGVEVSDKATPKNPYLSEAVLKRYPHLAKKN
jgi:predicted FMN-binding regulatory protein PaiB